MAGGLPSYRNTRFPDEKPPTIFAPATPKVKSTKSTKEADDGASMASTSTFSSTVGLIKSKLPISYKDYKARKESEAEKKAPQASRSRKSNKQPTDWDARARTTEAFMFIAMSK